VLGRLGQEISALLDALTSPNKLVAEVEAMRKLQIEADRIEATQPVRAAVLRRQAARVGLKN
jgi:Tfp pilus assembly protein FimV